LKKNPLSGARRILKKAHYPRSGGLKKGSFSEVRRVEKRLIIRGQEG
jgi:hypothetical protein